jgi:glycerol-3-phosphate dehydrogenase (NAD(P)+)
VIGDGAWGTALAMILSSNGHDVRLWGPFPEYTETMRASRENSQFLPGVRLADDILLTSDAEQAAAGADLCILAVPTKYFRDVVGSFRGLITPHCDVVSVAKGLDQTSHQRMSRVAEELLGVSPVSALSGPSHAEEVARNIPTAVTLASSEPNHAVRLQRLMARPCFRIYSSDDIVGVELGGALKNVIAIAVGMSDGLGFGDNTRAALITRGLAEMTRLGVALGARPATFSGLSGMGDLIVTCTSSLSRNRAVGERLGRGETIEQILANMKQAVEGVWNCASARALAHTLNVDVPVTEEVYAIVHEHKSPQDAVGSLLERSVRAELDG